MQNSDVALPDITEIYVNTELPIQERLQRFASEMSNPYQFRVGDTIVNVRYNQQACTLEKLLTRCAAK